MVDRMAASFSVRGQRDDDTFDLPLNGYVAQSEKVDVETSGEGSEACFRSDHTGQCDLTEAATWTHRDRSDELKGDCSTPSGTEEGGKLAASEF